jgi:glycosyltransferase involved in cell wall biosynthesis
VRILHVIGGVADVYGGPSKVAKEMCRSLARRGHHVELITTDAAFGERLDVALGEPVPTDGYTTWFHPCRLPRNPHIAPELVWDVGRRASRFDVTHVHGVFNFPATFSQLALRLRRLPYIVRPCGLMNRYGLLQNALRKRLALALLEKQNLEHAAFVQASTEPERTDLANLGFEHVVVIPQGVEPIEPSAGASPLGAPYVLFVGRIAEVKGLPRLVRAFAGMEGHDDVLLVLAGPDEYDHRRAVERAARECGVLDRIVFTGMISGEDKARYLQHARAFALVSDSESFGVAAIEAATCGLPLLVTEGVGVANDVANSGAGLVVRANEQAVADGLTALLDRHDDYVQGARLLGASFAWDRTAVRLEALYARAARTRARRRATK